MLTKLCVVLLIFTSVKSIENVGLTKIITLRNSHHLPLESNASIAHVEKRDTKQKETEQVEPPISQPPDAKAANQSSVQDTNNVNTPKNPVNGQSEGGLLKVNPQLTLLSDKTANSSQNKSTETTKVSDASPNAKNITLAPTADNVKNNAVNATEAPNLLPATDSGVVKRGLIVFGGFALLAVAYFIFYRRKSKNYESNNTHGNSDANQFRYGVLESDDRRDNLELSRIPLTMGSDEEEEDDLEIFDLEQKKKSLSYVNLQTNDEDIVLHSSSKDESKNNLLLDIEDGPSDTLINWSNNGNKSIL